MMNNNLDEEKQKLMNKINRQDKSNILNKNNIQNIDIIKS